MAPSRVGIATSFSMIIRYSADRDTWVVCNVPPLLWTDWEDGFACSGLEPGGLDDLAEPRDLGADADCELLGALAARIGAGLQHLLADFRHLEHLHDFAMYAFHDLAGRAARGEEPEPD